MAGSITLTAGAWAAEVDPARGGAILSLRWRDKDVLRPTPLDATDMLDTACFPLVPYANRIADGRFAFGGRDVRLPVLDRFAPHALHGDGWRAPWTVTEQGRGRVAMQFDWPGAGTDGEGWAWAYEAEQVVCLHESGLRIDLSVRNRSGEAMPTGLGLHPYFARSDATTLRLKADEVWLTDSREIPSVIAPANSVLDWRDGSRLADVPFVDHCYEAWDGEAVLTTGSLSVSMRAGPEVARAQVYAPKHEAFACVEPVSHRPDAVHAPPQETSGLRLLAPDEVMTLWMEICAHES